MGIFQNAQWTNERTSYESLFRMRLAGWKVLLLPAQNAENPGVWPEVWGEMH